MEVVMKRICKLISLSLIVSMITCVSINCFGLYGASTSYSVEVNFNKYYLCVGEQYTPSVTKTPSTLYVNWQSSNNSIAIVSNDGTITGVSLGNVTICLTYQNENSNTVLEEFDLLIVDTRGLENNTSYHIANCATGRLLAAGVEEPDDYGDVVVLRNEWTDKTEKYYFYIDSVNYDKYKHYWCN